MDLLSVVRSVLGHWKLIFGVTMLALGAAYGLLRAMPTLYESSAEILVFDPQSQLDDTVQKPISPFRNVVDNTAMNTEIEVLESKSVALRVAKELELDKDPEFQGQGRLSVLAERVGLTRLPWFQTPPPPFSGDPDELRAERLDLAAAALLKKLKVQQIPFSYILTVSVAMQSPAKAQRLTDAIANDFLTSQREARQEALQRVVSWLKGRVDDLQSHVLETEAAIEKLKTAHGLSDTDTLSQGVKDQQIAGLNAQLVAARGEIADKRAHLEQARSAEAAGHIEDIPELAASPIITQLRQQQAALGWRETQLRGKLGDNHAEVIAVGVQLADINRRLNDEAQRVLGNLNDAYDIAARREQSLQTSLRSLTAPQGDSAASLQLRNFQRTAEADRKLHDSYLVQYNESSQRLTLQEASARIITPATFPAAPSSPRRFLIFAAAGVFGLGGGLGLTFLLEFLQAGLKSGTQVEQVFGYPVVGVIPAVHRRGLRQGRHDGLARSVIDQPLSQLSEAVRAMRIGLELSNSEQSPKVILVTSSLPAEGKSTAALLLGASSAMSGRRTVLIDCDLRRQSISAICEQKEPGLSELLRGTADLSEVIRKHPAMGADMIPAGSIVRNPADLLMSQRMRELVAELRERYDYVVIDAAPLLPVVDALALAAMADKILVIVEWNRTPRASVSEAFKVLRPERGRIAGIVLNKADLRHVQSYGYGSSYHSLSKYFSSERV